jgi:hypothetical protein
VQASVCLQTYTYIVFVPNTPKSVFFNTTILRMNAYMDCLRVAIRDECVYYVKLTVSRVEVGDKQCMLLVRIACQGDWKRALSH